MKRKLLNADILFAKATIFRLTNISAPSKYINLQNNLNHPNTDEMREVIDCYVKQNKVKNVNSI